MPVVKTLLTRFAPFSNTPYAPATVSKVNLGCTIFSQPRRSRFLITLEAPRWGPTLVMACPNGSFPDYGENATSPEGLYLCVRVHSTVWFALGGSIYLLLVLVNINIIWQGKRCISNVHHINKPSTNSEPLLHFVGFLVYSFLFLGGFQRDYDIGFYVLVGSSATMTLGAVAIVMVHALVGICKKLIAVAMKNGILPVIASSVPTQKRPTKKKWDHNDRVAESVAKNVYSDLSMPLARVFNVAAAQVMLCCFYIYALATNGRPDFSKTDTYLFYFAGTFVQIVLVGRNQMSVMVAFSRGDRGSVYKMALTALSDDVPLHDEEGNIFLLSSWKIHIRMALDFIINVIGGLLIHLVLPLQLAGTSENYFDFLLNSCATIFVLELDDKEDVTFKLGPGPANLDHDETLLLLVDERAHYVMNEEIYERGDIDIRFAPCDKFEGARAGQVFKNDYSGIGYYADTCIEADTSCISLSIWGEVDEGDDTPPTIHEQTMGSTSRGEVNERLRENIAAA